MTKRFHLSPWFLLMMAALVVALTGNYNTVVVLVLGLTAFALMVVTNKPRGKTDDAEYN